MKLILVCLGLLATLAAASDLYDYGRSPVVQLTADNFKQKVLDSNETWFVEFYAPWCGHCRNLVPAWEKAAEHMKGVVNFGGVNCDEHKDIAGKYGVRGFPTIKVFKGSGARARRPTEYQGARSAKALVDSAKSEIPDNVVEIKAGGIDYFLDDDKHLPHVILFTDKPSTSPVYKSLSSSFLGKVVLGEIKKKEAEAIKSKFNVDKYPAFVSFAAGANSGASEKYNGATDPVSLRSFIGSLAGQASSAKDDLHDETGKVGDDDAAAEEKKTFYQPTEHSEGVEKITDGDAFERLCSKRLDSATCIALFIKNEAEGEKSSKVFDALAARYRFDNFAFVSIDIASAGEPSQALADALELDLSSGAALAVIRGRRSKFAPLESDPEGVTQNLAVTFLDRVLGGDVRYKKMPEVLPVWPGAAAPEDGEGDDVKSENARAGDESSGGDNETAEEVAEGEMGTADIPPGGGRAKEFGAGSGNDPQVHPGEQCEPGAAKDDAEEKEL